MLKKLLTATLASVLSIAAPAQTTSWGNIAYKGRPWVENASRPNATKDGLQGRHLSLWASHGRYYDISKGEWRWQRPFLFCTTEDLFTQTFVVPYLIPMLENAGAVVFTPRERDWQRHEIIVDNDRAASGYKEFVGKRKWSTSDQAGFAFHNGNYADLENPFTQGTARKAKSSKRKKKSSEASYQPYIPEAGRYAVYVSYQTLPKSVDDAEYTVYHKGQATTFHVNQQMGGGTWVYLGTFDFDKGSNIFNRVVVSNHSESKGIVTTDAVRFGGGMGNIVRGGTTSGMPRALEAARYYTQWAGAPKEVVSRFNQTNDYNDDLNARSGMLNWLAGGSPYVPNIKGKNVPLELQVAIHSDAGYKADGSMVGTLGICTTESEGSTLLGSGLSRKASKTFAQELVNNAKRDIEAKFGVQWATRSVWDKNYNETRRPEIPSAIIETLSHQNFQDMRYGLDPHFRFTLARSIYKTILRFTANMHGTRYTVTPLAPANFRIELTKGGKAKLAWDATNDATEPTARATSYNVYTAIGVGGFDNGVNIQGTNCEIDIDPNTVYNFKITACNDGGESFPTEVLSVCHRPNAKQTILIVNGFHRLSSPAVVNTDSLQGFDLDKDPGVSYGLTAGWAGRQINFNRNAGGREGVDGLGYSSNELQGKFIAGNSFDYVRTHADAIASTGQYNIVSCNSTAVERGTVSLSKYACVDLLLGLEKDDGHSLVYYKALSGTLRNKLTAYLTQNRGRLLTSGAYLASDTQAPEEQQWLGNLLKVAWDGTNYQQQSERITGLGTSFDIYRMLNEHHYAAWRPDALRATGAAFGAMQYSNGQVAAVAYQGNDYKTFTMAFPFECIKDSKQKNAIMKGILNFLMAQSSTQRH